MSRSFPGGHNELEGYLRKRGQSWKDLGFERIWQVWTTGSLV